MCLCTIIYKMADFYFSLYFNIYNKVEGWIYSLICLHAKFYCNYFNLHTTWKYFYNLFAGDWNLDVFLYKINYSALMDCNYMYFEVLI